MMSSGNDPESGTFDPFMSQPPSQHSGNPNFLENTMSQPNSTPMMQDMSSSFAPVITPLNENYAGPMNTNNNNNNNNNTNTNNNSTPGSSMGSDVNVNQNQQSLCAMCLSCSCLTIDSYRPHFDVNTSDVQHRIVASLRHFNDMGGLKEYVLQGKNPDAYGPFWISTTLVFFVAVTSNISAYLHAEDSSNFQYDVSHLFRAMILLYSYTFILPFSYYVLFNCLAINMSFMELFCLYGYSLVPYAPMTLFCVIPDNILVWFLLVIATGMSLIFVLRNIVGVVMEGDRRQQQIGGPILASVIGSHIVFLLIMKLGFYHHV